MRILSILALTAAALLALAITAFNPEQVTFELAFVRFDAPLGFVVIVVFVLGLLAGMLWRVRWVAELLSERGRMRRALRLAESRARANAVVGDQAAGTQPADGT
jgi:uncharacterized integral membrane protein